MSAASFSDFKSLFSLTSLAFYLLLSLEKFNDLICVTFLLFLFRSSLLSFFFSDCLFAVLRALLNCPLTKVFEINKIKWCNNNDNDLLEKSLNDVPVCRLIDDRLKKVVTVVWTLHKMYDVRFYLDFPVSCCTNDMFVFTPFFL